ncbi:hypothetical protein AD935_00395 [Gluconobacter japonicus]|nr:hypothetical protein AD935_00395 [Gluconobacter japonicus]
MKSHLISYDLLSKAHYTDMEGAALNQSLKPDFNLFLRDQANLVFAAMISLVDENSPTFCGRILSQIAQMKRSHEA